MGNLRIIEAAHELDRNMPGLYVASGEGASFRIYGWAANVSKARKLRAAVRKNPALYHKGEA